MENLKQNLKNILLTFISVLLFGLNSFAELRLDTPENLLKKASEGRIQLREVILDIQQSYPELRDPTIFEKYFYLLDQLSEKAKQSHLDEIYPLAVEKLGITLSGHGIKWLSVSKDSTEKILYYHRWMNVDVASSFAAQIEYNLPDVSSDPEFKQAALNLDALRNWLKSRFPEEKNLLMLYDRFLTNLANTFLKRDDLPESEIQFWISKISTPTGFSDAIETVQQKLLFVSAANKETLHVYLNRLFLIKQRYKAALINPPQGLVGYLGDVVTEITEKILFLEVNFVENEFDSVLDILSIRHLRSMASILSSPDHLPSRSYTKTYLKVADQLIEKLKTSNLTKEAYDLSLYIGRIAAHLISTEKGLEGTYLLEDSSGRKWNFTFVKVKESLIYAALADEDRSLFKTFFNITYNLKTNEFVASEREPDLDSSAQLLVKFKFDDQGGIHFEDLAAVPSMRFLNGKKTENYPDFIKEGLPTSEIIDGIYTGTMTFAGGHESEVTLSLTNLNGYTLGRLSDQYGVIFDMNMGTSGSNSVLYLTSGRLRPAAFGHIRLKHDAGTLTGYIITGGRGISPKEFKLKKIKEIEL